jgi:ribonuclease HIII
MTTKTFVLAEARIEALRTRLEYEGYEFNSLQYGHFSARSPGVVVNAYRSGKVVFQGSGAELASRRLSDLLGETAAEAAAKRVPGLPLIGTDEAGKGDYFGSLAVGGVAVERDQAWLLEDIGVRDCKKMSDEAVLRVDVEIRESLPHALVVLEPEEYNRTHQRVGNVNRILADAHAKVIATLRRECPGIDRVLVDRFGSESLVSGALEKRRVKAKLFQKFRAEDSPVVAAASIVARAAFLRSLDDLYLFAGEDLPKGAADSKVLAVGRRILEREGRKGLGRVAKLHFKTTLKLSGAR